MDLLKQGVSTLRTQIAETSTSGKLAYAGGVYLTFLVYYLGESRKVSHIPTVGSSSAVLSYVDLVKFMMDSPRYVTEAFSKLRSGVIKVPGLFNWVILVNGHDLVEEMRKAPDNQLDMDIAVEEALQTRYTLGEAIASNPYHVPIVRNQLKRATPQLVPIVHEELATAFDEYIAAPTTEWKKIPAQEIVMKTVCRASNRTFVGLPLCRNLDYIDLNVNYTLDVIKGGALLKLMPAIIRPLFAPFLTAKKRVDQGLRHISPLIKERRAQIELLGDEYERPVDFLQWLIDEAKGDETAERALTLRIMVLNFAAIHTSTMTFLQALYDLAAHPEYQEVLREEAFIAIKEYGWTKDAVDKLNKSDSFIKESQRLRPMSSVMMNRVAMEDYTFGDGSKVPKGSTVSVDIQGMHREYPSPDEFDPWRFNKIQEETGKRSDITTTTAEFLAFGHGRHACPGRFFAAVELKLMMAYLVLNYDIKCEDGKRPADIWFGPNCIPNPKAQLLFRKREEASI